jgi:hypothetical protein
MSISSTTTTTLPLTLSDADDEAQTEPLTAPTTPTAHIAVPLPSQSLSAQEQTPPFEINSSQLQQQEGEEGEGGEGGEATTPPPVLRRMCAFVVATPSGSLSLSDNGDT